MQPPLPLVSFALAGQQQELAWMWAAASLRVQLGPLPGRGRSGCWRRELCTCRKETPHPAAAGAASPRELCLRVASSLTIEKGASPRSTSRSSPRKASASEVRARLTRESPELAVGSSEWSSKRSRFAAARWNSRLLCGVGPGACSRPLAARTPKKA